MKINLILTPEQEPATLLAMQAQHPDNFFYLGKESQLAGTNVLLLDVNVLKSLARKNKKAVVEKEDDLDLDFEIN